MDVEIYIEDEEVFFSKAERLLTIHDQHAAVGRNRKRGGLQGNQVCIRVESNDRVILKGVYMYFGF